MPSRSVADPVDGGELLLAACTLREGDWPQVVLTYADGRILYQAAGLPTLLPVLTRAIATEDGKPLDLPQDAGTAAGLNHLLGTTLTNCTAKDYLSYEGLKRQARIFNSRSDAAGAEEAYLGSSRYPDPRLRRGFHGSWRSSTALALEVSNGNVSRKPLRFPPGGADPRKIVQRPLSRPPFGLPRPRRRQSRPLRRGVAAGASRHRLTPPLGRYRDRTQQRRRVAGRTGNQPRRTAPQPDDRSADAAAARRPRDRRGSGGEALDLVVRTPGLPPWWRPNVLAFTGDLNIAEGRFAVAERQHIDALKFRREIFGEPARDRNVASGARSDLCGRERKGGGTQLLPSSI